MGSKSSPKHHNHNHKHKAKSLKEIEEQVMEYTHEKVFKWIRLNLKTVGIVLGGIALLLIIIMSWRSYKTGMSENALSLEGTAFKRHKEIQTQLASKSEDAASDEQDAQDPYKEVIGLYQELLDQYPGTPSAARAHFMLGNLAYQSGSYDQAKEYFAAYLKAAPEGKLTLQAKEAQANVLEQQQAYADALAAFKQLEADAPTEQKPRLLLAIARNYEALDKSDEAIAAYQSIIDSNTSASLKNTAKERLAILQSPKEYFILPDAVPEVEEAVTEETAVETAPEAEEAVTEEAVVETAPETQEVVTEETATDETEQPAAAEEETPLEPQTATEEAVPTEDVTQ